MDPTEPPNQEPHGPHRAPKPGAAWTPQTPPAPGSTADLTQPQTPGCPTDRTEPPPHGPLWPPGPAEPWPWLGALGKGGGWGSWHPGVLLVLQGELSPAPLPPGCSLEPPGASPLRWLPPAPLTLPSASPQSRDRKVLGDYSGALSYGSTAKYLNITAHLISIFLIALIIALIATGTITVVNILQHQQEQHPFFGPT